MKKPAAPVTDAAAPGSAVAHVCALMVSRHVRCTGRLTDWLSPEERAQAQRFYRESDRNRFILGRGMVRHLCGIYLGVAPAEVRLDKTPAGKPCLAHPIPAGRQRFEFNLAHSGDWVLVAWAEGFTLGVDVEALDPDASRTLAGEVSASVFSPDERAVLSAAKPEEVPGTFYRIWVRKEAVLKAEGCGLGGAPESFSVAHRPPGGRTEWLDEVPYTKSGRRWKIIDLTPGPGYLAAAALPQNLALRQRAAPEIGFPE